jgi:hypothetical protein
MPDLILAAAEYGNYVSPVKLAVFLILFFLSLPVLNWVFRDTRKVKTREILWTAVLFAAVAAGALIWLMMPVFIFGMLLYLVLVAAVSVSYIRHRNARVAEFERILTPDHIKGIFEKKKKTTVTFENLTFITSKNDEADIPQPNTPEFFGYKAAYDLFSDAVWRRASDIILSPTHQNYNLIYYVDGAALTRPALDREQADYLIHFVKNIANLDIS